MTLPAPSSPSAEELAGVCEGEVLAGKYRVDKILGAGGMGVVVAAYNIALDTRVALKFLLPALLSNREAMTRFADEARNAVKIASEHVARIFDVGTLENGAPYIVMEFLEGEDLATWLKLRGPLPIEQAAEFVLQACVAVADAHGLGIVHRDLKPANLFCVRRSDGRLSVKVLDFGISKLTLPRPSDPPGMSVTKTSAVMGSPYYMSPEQVQNAKGVDARTDVWALGVILFELLTGNVPFRGETLGEIAVKIAIRPPAPMRESRPDLPEALEAVVLRCLEKDRERRYRNVAELAVALLPFAPRRAKSLVERITDIIQASGLSASALALPPSPRPDDKRQETLLAPESVAPWSGPPGVGSVAKAAWGVGVAIALLTIGVGVVIFRRPPLTPQRAAVSGESQPSLILSDAAAAPATGAAVSSVCTSGATQCSETTAQTCTGGQWESGPVVAGQCGAVCTPGSSPDRCTGSTPQRCAPTGTWVDGPMCNRSQVCRNGDCVAVVPDSPAKPKPRKPDCDPSYTLDEFGQKHFKPECFP